MTEPNLRIFSVPRDHWDRIVAELGFGSGIPGQTGSTIGAESRATRRLMGLFEGDPNSLLTKKRCEEIIRQDEPLGARAFDRVWWQATAQFPNRSRPGRRRNRIATPD